MRRLPFKDKLLVARRVFRTDPVPSLFYSTFLPPSVKCSAVLLPLQNLIDTRVSRIKRAYTNPVVADAQAGRAAKMRTKEDNVTDTRPYKVLLGTSKNTLWVPILAALLF